MDAFPCPSFNVYASSENSNSISIADIADRVTREARDQHSSLMESDLRNDEDNDEEEIELITFQKHSDELQLEGGEVGPLYPVFNRDLLVGFGSAEEVKSREDSARPEDGAEEELASLRIPLKDLFLDDDEDGRRLDMDPHSSSSSEAGDSDSVPPGSYCVWIPASARASPSSCRKSKSAGSSSPSNKKWKLLDLLRRSNSDGKDNFVFLSPSTSNNKKVQKSSDDSASDKSSNRTKIAGKSKAKVEDSSLVKGHRRSKMSAHEIFYVRNRALKEEDKRRSYLPYRLVGFNATLGLGGSLGGKSFPPF